ncbi:ABC transporter ATP-binding protein [Spiractinospora alimapuensis]|uniref:ABC transporter ATP-binding protein n=1 Tax=Spiractinospora alimapuensis TaxID=2820884 RepID=UPI001F2F9C42|nr:ABC transporter ATP-binding protein [Spiractinospora alimapuensis]QVQ53488.1 ABC transporter ATP-binding protein [Spiractinospora alimapuensis]
MQAQTATVELERVQVRFGDTTAVHQADLRVKSGEFFTLLGPSGCGKTTLLRAVAGFTTQTSGHIRIGDTLIDRVPAHKRDTGMVFQSYAIFPHLSVWGNVAYALKSRGIRGQEAKDRILEALELVDLAGYEKRSPRQLSGGQQQRVVIARALVARPRVLLMDEPLANLDAKLRVRLRHDLKDLQAKLGITTIYVTHDQDEALSLSDRIAVMSAGRILQVGTPEEIYETPVSLRVAEFIGEGTFLRGSARADGDTSTVSFGDAGTLRARGAGAGLAGDVWLGFRPQDVRADETTDTVDTPPTPDMADTRGAADRTDTVDTVDESDGPDEATVPAGAVERRDDVAVRGGGNVLRGHVVSRFYYGPYVRFELDIGLDRTVSLQLDHSAVPRGVEVGSPLAVRVDETRVMVFPGVEEEGEL